MPRIGVAAISMESRPGDKPANLARIEEWSTKAVREGAKLVCFPAMAVTGYWRTGEVFPHGIPPAGIGKYRLRLAGDGFCTGVFLNQFGDDLPARNQVDEPDEVDAYEKPSYKV